MLAVADSNQVYLGTSTRCCLPWKERKEVPSVGLNGLAGASFKLLALYSKIENLSK